MHSRLRSCAADACQGESRLKLLELLGADDGGDPVGSFLLADRSATVVNRPRALDLHLDQQGNQVFLVLLRQIEVFEERASRTAAA
jgi:hypothetical protein